MELAALCNKLQISVSMFLVSSLDVIEICEYYENKVRVSFSGNHYNSVRVFTQDLEMDVCDSEIMQ